MTKYSEVQKLVEVPVSEDLAVVKDILEMESSGSMEKCGNTSGPAQYRSALYDKQGHFKLTFFSEHTRFEDHAAIEDSYKPD